MLAGLANRRLPENPPKIAVFRQLRFSSKFLFILAGLANPRLPRKPKICSFSSNALLVSFNFHAGRACQPSVARKPDIFLQFSSMQLLSRLCSCWPGLPTVGSPETQKYCRFSSNAILASFYVHAGRAYQPLVARKGKIICRFSSNAILVSFNVHAGRACQP